MSSHWSAGLVAEVRLGQKVPNLGVSTDDGFIARVDGSFVVRERLIGDMFCPFATREDLWSKMDQLADEADAELEVAMERQRWRSARARRYAGLYVRVAEAWVDERTALFGEPRRVRDDKFERVLARMSRVVAGAYKKSSRVAKEKVG